MFVPRSPCVGDRDLATGKGRPRTGDRKVRTRELPARGGPSGDGFERWAMTTICWTVIHHAAAPLLHGAAHSTRMVGHILGPSVHRITQVLHLAKPVVPHPHVWFEVVCKVIPAAVVGGGLLVPHPAGPPALRELPALIHPAPAARPWLPWNGSLPPTVSVRPAVGPPPISDVPEPSTGPLLLIGAGGVVLIQLAFRRANNRYHITHPGSDP
jgi:hypothetical protein